MFDFRLITLLDGNQIIDNTLKTPYNALTPAQMLEYMEVDNSISIIQRMERKRKAEETRRKAFAYRLKMALAILTGIKRGLV